MHSEDKVYGHHVRQSIMHKVITHFH